MLKQKQPEKQITLRGLNNRLLSMEPDSVADNIISLPAINTFDFTDVEHTFCQLVAKQRLQILNHTDYKPVPNAVLYIEALLLNNKIDKDQHDNLIDVGNKVSDYTIYIEQYTKIETHTFQLISNENIKNCIDQLFDDGIVSIAPYYCAKNREILLAKSIKECQDKGDIVMAAGLIRLLNTMQATHEKAKEKEKLEVKERYKRKKQPAKIQYQDMTEEDVNKLKNKRGGKQN